MTHGNQMNDSKMFHCVIGTAVTWGLTVWSWVETHSGLIVGGFAILASIFTIRAAHATTKLRQEQRRRLESEWQDDL